MTLLVSRSMATPRDSSQHGYTKRSGGSSTRKHANRGTWKFHLNGTHSAALMKHNVLVTESVCLKGWTRVVVLMYRLEAWKLPVLTLLIHKFSEQKLAPAICIKFKQINFNKWSISYNRKISRSQFFILLSRFNSACADNYWGASVSEFQQQGTDFPLQRPRLKDWTLIPAVFGVYFSKFHKRRVNAKTRIWISFMWYGILGCPSPFSRKILLVHSYDSLTITPDEE